MIKINDFKITNTSEGLYKITYKNLYNLAVLPDLYLAESFTNMMVAFINYHEYCKLFESSEDNQ